MNLTIYLEPLRSGFNSRYRNYFLLFVLSDNIMIVHSNVKDAQIDSRARRITWAVSSSVIGPVQEFWQMKSVIWQSQRGFERYSVLFLFHQAIGFFPYSYLGIEWEERNYGACRPSCRGIQLCRGCKVLVSTDTELESTEYEVGWYRSEIDKVRMPTDTGCYISARRKGRSCYDRTSIVRRQHCRCA